MDRALTPILDSLRGIDNSLKALVILIDKVVNQEVQIEALPPQCPHCGITNPTIDFSGTEGVGTLSQVVMIGTCQNCGNKVFAVPNVWDMQADEFIAQQIVKQLMERDNARTRISSETERTQSPTPPEWPG